MRYEVKGTPLPVVICNLEANETMVSEGGAMSWMSPNMQMETTSGGGFGKVMGRMFSGESLFLNRYTATNGPGMIAFASSFPGSIRAFELTPGRSIICQKSSYLASTEGIELSVYFRKKVGAGLFGGEGFIMQQLAGSGTAFIEIDGSAVEYDLAPGQQMVIDTGYLAMMDDTCSMDVVSVPGLKNMFFGGEGFFNTVITGPGHIILQTHPISAIARSIMPFMPKSS